MTKQGLKANFLKENKKSAVRLPKARIAKTIHNRLGFTNVRPAQLVDSLLEILKKTLENGEDVLISGFYCLLSLQILTKKIFSSSIK